MKEKKVYLALLVFLIITLVILITYCSEIALVSLLFMPILFGISKLLERLGWAFYRSYYQTDIIGLVVVIVALVILLIYDWREITYWFLIGTAINFFGVLISRKLYHRRK